MTGALLSAALAAAALLVLLGPPSRDPLARLSGRPRPPAGRLPAAVRARLPGARPRRDVERARAVEALGALAAELRAGRPVGAALASAAPVAVGPTGSALRAAGAAALAGGDVTEVLTEAADSSAVPDLLRGLAACWALCAQTGSGLAVAVERLELAERDAHDRRRAVDAELAGPRTTAALLAALPAVGVALAAALGARPLDLLLGTPLGLGCLVGGAVLDAVGLLWTRRLVARAVAR
ncbi:MAG TPA: type II secretion system F family protein [Mycobacteriales bacterium]|nr:type II secretion system F family protein [Mycobacteriales bacterium]